ncbi:hypothetical protein HMPREF9120_02653, partial [Neisseria sp. oral taxon 020 str. F0370]
VLILHLLLGEDGDALRGFFQFQIELGSGGAAFDCVVVAALARGVAVGADDDGADAVARINCFGGRLRIGGRGFVCRAGIGGQECGGNEQGKGFDAHLNLLTI